MFRFFFFCLLAILIGVTWHHHSSLQELTLPPLATLEPVFSEKQPDALDYIEQYGTLAQDEMKKHAIPASITLGQAILESKYGQSELALQANNHFGIKISLDWVESNRHCMFSNEWIPSIKKMKSILSCFKKYTDVGDCYANHSHFLVTKKWYKPLFKLPKKDYKAWAKGLQKAGYATDPHYANKLITIIEKYNLASYDQLPIDTIINTNQITENGTKSRKNK
jgi:flagellum-specific peptidoglycan hydrolase FlgJ